MGKLSISRTGNRRAIDQNAAHENHGTMYQKFILIEDHTAITGSLNFSRNADESNDDNVVIIANSVIAQEYLEDFKKIWTEAKEPIADDLGC